MTDEETSGENPPVLDAAQVADLIGLDQGRGALFTRFVELFVSGTAEKFARLYEHAQTSNVTALAEAAHSLRGASGNVGAARLSGLFERIEVAARGGDIGAATALIASLEAEYAVTRVALVAASTVES